MKLEVNCAAGVQLHFQLVIRPSLDTYLLSCQTVECERVKRSLYLSASHWCCRSGIDKNTGTHWLRVEQPKEGKTVFKQMEVEAETLVATDKDNNVFYKFGFNKELKGKN